MRIHKSLIIAMSSLFLLVSCATTPRGPTAQVMPSPNKPFEVFQQDQALCKQYAQSQVAGQADAANNAAVGKAALGTALGVGLGAALRGHRGAGVGAATGAIVGTAAGTNSSRNAQLLIQDQYNNAYVQCMYAKGNQVPGAAPSLSASLPPPGMAPPPGSVPPPGTAPPPGVEGNSAVHGATKPHQTMTLAQAQARLNVLGFLVGRPDGMMGPKTRTELMLFQKSRGISETGELDTETVTMLTN